MKKYLTLALAIVALAVLTGFSVAQGAQQKDKQKSPPKSAETKPAPTTPPAATAKNSAHATERVMAGTVTKANEKDKSFTLTANGKQFTFSAKKLKDLPKVEEKIIEVTYIQATPGGELEAVTVKSSKSKNASDRMVDVKASPKPTTGDIKDPVGPGAGNNVTIKPSGSTPALAPQESGTWTKAGTTVRLSTSTDNVGIGTTKPIAKLDVAGVIHASEAVRVGNSVGLLSSSSLNLIEVDDSHPLAIGFSNPMSTTPSTVPFSTIKVGIGTLSPTATLHINGTTRFSGIATLDSGVQLQAAVPGGARILGEQGNTPARPAIGFFSTNGVDDGGVGNGIFRPLANTMAFATVSTERMRITSGGAVGIATTSPTNTLDVNGTARIRGLTPSPSPLLNDVVVADPTGVLFTRPASTLGGGGSYWSLTGNAATPGNFLGTTVNLPLEIRVNNSRALLIQYSPQAPNIIGGSPANSVTAGVGGATIGGGGFAGNGNTVTANFGTVGGGRKNQAGNLATVGGGFVNTASGPNSTVSGGTNNTASGSIATVSGGSSNTAGGNVSFAAGCQAKANHNGAFVWADVIGCGTPLSSSKADEFTARASGGYRFFSDSAATVGAFLFPGATAWSAGSDRNVKENFQPIEGRLILQKLSLIPITEWNLKSQDPSIRHIGPMAQDVYAAFGMGESDRHISSIDAAGITMVSIQALYQMSLEKDKKIEELQQRIEKLERLVGTLTKKQ